MAVTQYIGARYVPLFANPLEWSADRTYEPLTIVLHEGNSYTSRQYIPVGIQIDNEDFWALTGNYNAQVEQYRQDVNLLKKRICKQLDTASNFGSATLLNIGDVVITTGFNEINDGGSAVYIISETGSGNGYDSIKTRNGYANLVTDGNLNIKQLGFTGIDDQTDLVDYAVNHYSVDFANMTVPIYRTINITNKTSIRNGVFEAKFSPQTLTYIFNAHTDLSINTCEFISENPDQFKGGIQTNHNLDVDNCSFDGFAYCITKSYDETHARPTVKVSNVDARNCRVVVHLCDCMAFISNIDAKDTFTTSLLSSMFYIRTDVEAHFTNISCKGYDGSTFHVNRFVDSAPIPPFSQETPHKSFIYITNVNTDSPRLIDINNQADIYITNANDTTAKSGRATVEFRNGYGSLNIYNSTLHSVLMTEANPLPDETREISLIGCNVLDYIYDDTVNTKSPTDIVLKDCQLHHVIKRKGNVQITGSTFLSEGSNSTPGITLYTDGSKHFITECVKRKTGLLVNLTSTSANNALILTNNTVYSSNYLSNSGTSNTVKENNNFAFGPI